MFNRYEDLREPTDNKLLSATLCLYMIIYFKLSYIGGTYNMTALERTIVQVHIIPKADSKIYGPLRLHLT